MRCRLVMGLALPIILLVASPILATSIGLDDIIRIRNVAACNSCPGGRVKAIVDFRLQVEQPDLALGPDYFPITDLTGKVMNQSEWREETARAGAKYRSRVIYTIPRGYRGHPPTSYDVTRLFNGVESWRHFPRTFHAERTRGVTRGSQVVQDFYGDLIGSEIKGGNRGMSRTVPAEGDAPYDLDQILRSGEYRIAGEEIIEGEPCVVIERSGVDRVWLAGDKSFCIVRREWSWTPGGPLKRRILNGAFRQIAAGAWLPFEGRMEIFGHPTTCPGRRIGVLHAIVRDAAANIPDSVFEPDFVKGTVVIDLDTGERFAFGMDKDALAIAELKVGLNRTTE